MDLKDRRIWYAVAAVIIVLIIIGYATGWFGGEPAVTAVVNLPPSQSAVCGMVPSATCATPADARS